MLLRSIHNKKKKDNLNKKILKLQENDVLIIKYPIEWIEKYDSMELSDLFNDMRMCFREITSDVIFIPENIKFNVIKRINI